MNAPTRIFLLFVAAGFTAAALPLEALDAGLQEHVDEQGLVNYQALRADWAALYESGAGLWRNLAVLRCVLAE